MQLMASEDAEYASTEEDAVSEGGIPRDPPQRDKGALHQVGRAHPTLVKVETYATCFGSTPHATVVEVRDSGVAVLDGSDAARIEEQVKNLAHNPLPIHDPNTYPERFNRNAI